MKKKILLIYKDYSTFVKNDFNILTSEFDVVKYQYKPVFGFFKSGKELIKQFVFLLCRSCKFDVFFIWFADYHSFLPVAFAKLLGKKSFVVNGGYDVAHIPELNYGSFNNPLRAFLTKQTLRHASLCLPVAESLEKSIHSICPKAKVKVINTGHDSSLFNYSADERKKTIFTLSGTNDQPRFLIKGLDRFKDLACHLKDYTFTVIGIRENAVGLFRPVPENLIILSPVRFDELKKVFRESSFYAQFSRSEGFPSALCEAMLSGCIPLGSNVGDINDIIGDTGFVFNDWDPEEIRGFIVKNHNNSNLRKKARDKILTNYPTSKRADKIIRLII